MTTNESDFLHFLKTRELDFDLAGKYEVPRIKGIKLKDLSSVKLIGFNYATNIKSMQERGNEFVHFFLPDTYIERVWDNPDYYGAVFAQYKGIIQPDLSQYTTMPRAMQIWNYYRNMWLAAYYIRVRVFGLFHRLSGLTRTLMNTVLMVYRKDPASVSVL